VRIFFIQKIIFPHPLSPQSPKSVLVEVGRAEVGDEVMAVWDEHYSNYRILGLHRYIHFLNPDCQAAHGMIGHRGIFPFVVKITNKSCHKIKKVSTPVLLRREKLRE